MLKKAVQQVGHEQIGRNRGPAPWNIVDFLKNIGRKKIPAANDSGMFPETSADIPAGHKNQTRSEILSSMPRRGTARFLAETRKHPVFCGNLRIT